ncbi:preprotein translocase subunit SecG [Helicobacter marmotae]|uniref:Protein-export membrane protein SecG n=1 Tax=Helicobacter marmotae TaxID=152490 RepID=A0A3D8I4P9_9HELI|nr:preprotein translocase subunit SecG [Helicobacter marmotae]RDU60132.1 preprotein translocase subunit SecG [Helicobacter marmotae]
MTTALFIIQIILAVLITIVVLLQKSSSIGLGAYSGSNESVFGARGPAGFLAKFTMLLGLLFMLNTIALGYSYNKASEKSVVDTLSNIPSAPTSQEKSNAEAFIVDENAAPSAPLLAPTQESK